MFPARRHLCKNSNASAIINQLQRIRPPLLASVCPNTMPMQDSNQIQTGLSGSNKSINSPCNTTSIESVSRATRHTRPRVCPTRNSSGSSSVFIKNSVDERGRTKSKMPWIFLFVHMVLITPVDRQHLFGDVFAFMCPPMVKLNFEGK